MELVRDKISEKKEDNKSKTIVARFKIDECALLESEAQRLMIPVSTLMRLIIVKVLKESEPMSLKIV